MDDAESTPYDPLYLAGIEKFNECDYYESHEVWEELWTEYRGPSRKFYQGLIQAAVALYHFGNGNIRGARKLHRQRARVSRALRPASTWASTSSGFWPPSTRCLAEVAASTEDFPDIRSIPNSCPRSISIRRRPASFRQSDQASAAQGRI
jgi:uncharacterized protein